MNKYRYGLLRGLSIALLLTLFLVMSVAAGLANSSVKPTENGQDYQWSKMSNEDLVTTLNTLSDKLSEKKLIGLASELYKRKDAISNDYIIEKIKDKNIQGTTKEVLADLLIAKIDFQISPDIRQLLKDQTIDAELKAKILINSKFDNSDLDLLKNFIENDNGILAFDSLKKLTQVNISEAYPIAKKILSNYKSESNFRISAAQKCVSKYLRKHADSNDTEEFIDQATKLIDDPMTDPMIKDSSIFALSDMMSKDAIVALIESKSIDKTYKVFAIDENYYVLQKILQDESCNENDIKIVVEAMELRPIRDIYSSLKDKEAAISDPELKERCQRVLDNIQSNGKPATKKWLEM